MLNRITVAMILFVYASIPSQCRAQEAKRSWWNPLGLIKEDATRSSSFYENIEASADPVQPASAWFAMPEFSKPKFPTMQKLGASTKSMWVKTTRFLNPFDDEKVDKSLVPSDQGYKPQLEKEKPKRRFFSWLWEKPAETQPPQSVNDWLNQDNPVLDPSLY